VVGALLLSHPRLGDYFHRKVILLVSHDGMGTTGYVLNEAAQLRLGQLLPRGDAAQAEQLDGDSGSGGGAGRFAGGRRARRRRRGGAALSSAPRSGPSFLHVPLSAAEVAMLSSDTHAHTQHDHDDDDSAHEYDPDGHKDAYDDTRVDEHAGDGDVAFDMQQLEDAVAAAGGETTSFSIDVGDGHGITVTAISAGGDNSAFSDEQGFFAAAAKAAAGVGGGAAGEASFLRVTHEEACERLADAAGPALLRRCGRADVYNGGPVPGGGVLHTCEDIGGVPVLPPDASPAGGGRAVFAGGDVAALAKHVGGSGGVGSQTDVRFFAGEAGWAAGQLDAELARGEWLLAQGSAAWVLGGAAHAPGEQRGCMWQRALRALGGEHAVMAGLPAHLGPDQAQAAPQFMLRMRL
jgi:putative AlgH/UPF0301 family transcriptional regulator